MNSRYVFLLISMLISCYQLNSQSDSSVDKLMEYMEYIEDMEDETLMESLYSELSYMASHPLELNGGVTEEELQKLPFLSDNQIQGLLSYVKRHGPMLTVYELKNVEELDFQTIKLLLPFVYVSGKAVDKRPLTVNNLLAYGRNELQVRYDQCFQQKQGYRSQPAAIMEKYPNRKYLGEPFYNSVRYAYTFDNRLQAGLTAEKDAGEPMWNKHNKGYDFYSFHLLAKDLGWLKTLVAGDYKMSFGQGLVASNDFAPGRNAIVAQAERRGYGFRRHFSTNENDFFRGMATTARWDNIYLSLFYSYKRMDATMSDSLTASSIKTDGLHRLPGERDKTGVLPMQTFGGNMSYIAPKLCLGLTAIRYSFGDYSVIPADRPYNVFYFRGNENLNMSVDYKIKSRKLKFYGETAISANKAVATLNAVQLTPASHLSFLLLYRYYAEQYQAYFGNAFSQNTAVQNEQGLYAAMQISPFAYWKVSAYADFFRFPWLKYGVDAPSDGKEYMLQVDYTRMEDASFYLRYKYRQREKNQTLPPVNNTQVEPYGQHKVRFQAQYALRSCLFRTSVEGVAYSETGKQSSGMMAEQSLAWKPSLPLQADINVAYFHTDDYDTRLGSHEKNIPYVFNRPQLYGHGLRMSAIARYDISDNTNISAKLAHTHYFDREVTGTGTEEIEGNVKTDICILVRHKF